MTHTNLIIYKILKIKVLKHVQRNINLTKLIRTNQEETW